MDIQYVKKEMLENKSRRSSKYKELYDKLDQLEPGENAVQVVYNDDEDSINSMRVAVYQYNNRYGVKIKSTKEKGQNKIFFYIDQ